MIVAAMIGGLALLVTQIMKQQIKVQKKAESFAEVTSMTGQIRQLLLNQESCQNSFNGINAADLSAATLDEQLTLLTALRNRNNQEIFALNGTYANEMIQITMMGVASEPAPEGLDDPDPSDPNNQWTGSFSLFVEFQRVSRVLNQGAERQPPLRRRFPITLTFDLNGTVLSCNTDTNEAVETSIKKICNNLGGAVVDGNCELSDIPSDFFSTGEGEPNDNRPITERGLVSALGDFRLDIQDDIQNLKDFGNCTADNQQVFRGVTDGGDSIICASVSLDCVTQESIASVSCPTGYFMTGCDCVDTSNNGYCENGARLNSLGSSCETQNGSATAVARCCQVVIN